MFLQILILTFVGIWGQELKTIAKPDPHIIGGEDTLIGDYPHQVALIYKRKFFCGGSIISKKIVITAAHCYIKRNASSRYNVIAGITSLSEKRLEVPIEQFILHEKYNSTNFDYDVAIIVLKKLLVFNSNVKPITLSKSLTPVGAEVTLIGWGRLYWDGLISDHLKEVKIIVIDHQSCKNDYQNLLITDRMVCAKVENGGKGSCSGDSGGPVIFKNKLVGIISWGVKCGLKDKPTVFISVLKLYDWIKKTAKANDATFINRWFE